MSTMFTKTLRVMVSPGGTIFPCCGLLFVSSLILAQESYSPYADWQYPDKVFWGDMHVHSRNSWDSYSLWDGSGLGNLPSALSQEDAYRFAQGIPVRLQDGARVRLRRPLDFLLVADHAENLGSYAKAEAEADEKLYRHLESVRNRQSLWSTEVLSKKVRQSIWSTVIQNADVYNDPGRFTTFIGYEWTSAPGQANLHRVVIFKDSADKTGQVLPFGASDSENPEDLWRYFESYESNTGGEVLAIPHNPNLSKGRMFELTDYDGRTMDLDYAVTRARWEPLLEVTQMKGDSETHPLLSPTDEFADFQTVSSWQQVRGEPTVNETPRAREKEQYEYARSALKLGLKQKAELGVNPFKFGLVGSTDSHTGMSTADEDNFLGSSMSRRPSYDRLSDSSAIARSAAGYVGVWATENTREALFAAMKRKEVYATTGPRMLVRFFGGWDFETDDALKPDFVRLGYSKGVPMGGDLTKAPEGGAPSFLIRALKDPDGANLDRVQVIKGWRDRDGPLYERIYDVALSDGRVEAQNGKVPSVGNTVDVKSASYTNTIGDVELSVVWNDPHFNPNELAFYYVRVVEIPTPRWPAYDARFFGIKDIPDDVRMVSQERAYTSPIWYTPQ